LGKGGHVVARAVKAGDLLRQLKGEWSATTVAGWRVLAARATRTAKATGSTRLRTRQDAWRGVVAAALERRLLLRQGGERQRYESEG
jgi:hypothetical protein